MEEDKGRNKTINTAQIYEKNVNKHLYNYVTQQVGT